MSKTKLELLDAYKGKFMATHTSSYKQVVAFGETRDQDETLMSIDTGISGRIGQQNFIDMMVNHNKGKLVNIDTTLEKRHALEKKAVGDEKEYAPKHDEL